MISFKQFFDERSCSFLEISYTIAYEAITSELAENYAGGLMSWDIRVSMCISDDREVPR